MRRARRTSFEKTVLVQAVSTETHTVPLPRWSNTARPQSDGAGAEVVTAEEAADEAVRLGCSTYGAYATPSTSPPDATIAATCASVWVRSAAMGISCTSLLSW